MVVIDLPAVSETAKIMQIYLFWSGADAGVFGFTPDIAGTNLPADLAPWLKNGDGEAVFSCPEHLLTEVCRTNSVIRLVRQHGFYLARGRSPV